MHRLVAFAAFFCALPVFAEPDPPPRERCAVTILRAPDRVRREVEKWVRAEPHCTTSLELRVVPTDGGLYLLARDERGRVRERVVPDAQSVGVLVASWIADDGPTPPPRPMRAAHADRDDPDDADDPDDDDADRPAPPARAPRAGTPAPIAPPTLAPPALGPGRPAPPRSGPPVLAPAPMAPPAPAGPPTLAPAPGTPAPVAPPVMAPPADPPAAPCPVSPPAAAPAIAPPSAAPVAAPVATLPEPDPFVDVALRARRDESSGKWFTLGGARQLSGRSNTGMRVELDVLHRNWWTLGASASVFDGSTDNMLLENSGSLQMFFAATKAAGRWEVRAQVGAGASLLRTVDYYAYGWGGPANHDFSVEPMAEAGLLVSRAIGDHWALTAGPIVNSVLVTGYYPVGYGAYDNSRRTSVLMFAGFRHRL